MTALQPAYARAIWLLSLDGRDLAEAINPRFMSLSITECRSDDADQLDIELSDHDGLLELPSMGAVIAVQIGWDTTGLVDKGTFKVDDVSHRGAPDVVTIRARSADMTGPLRTRTERSYHGRSIRQIVDDIAAANSLEAAVGEMFSRIQIPHIDQTNESDINFLNRLGKRYDAVATVKEGRLLFMPIRGAKTVGGADMPHHTIYRRDGDQHEYSLTGRDAYTGVQASWMDPQQAQKRHVIVGVKDNAKHMRDTFANETDALAAAQAEWQRIQRGLATMRFTLAAGMPELSAQHTIGFPNIKPEIAAIKWQAKSVTHTISDNGLVSSLDLEQEGTEDAGAEADSVEME